MNKAQESQVKEYSDKMLRNGIKAGVKTDRAAAKSGIEFLYKTYMETSAPSEVVFVDSPQAAVKLAAKKTGMSAKDLVSEIIFTNLWTWWVAYYHAGINILGETSGVEQDLISNLNRYEQIVQQMHAILPLDEMCIVIEYPKTVAIKDDDLEKFQLHRDGGLAVEYQDGTGFAWLNGIEVPDYVATTPPSKLKVKKLLGETNVDVRREGLRRLPVARLLKDTKAKLLDTQKVDDFGRKAKKKTSSDRQLYSMDLGDNKKRVFLKMWDVASQAYCVERVEDNITTVLEARAWRNEEAVDRFVPESART